MEKQIADCVHAFMPALEKFVDEMAKYGMFLDDTRTLQIQTPHGTVYFGDKEIQVLRTKAKRFDKLAKMIEGELSKWNQKLM